MQVNAMVARFSRIATLSHDNRDNILMCYSATVSFSAAAVLLTTGVYTARQAWQLPVRYWLWALMPLLFGLQQAFEGGVWQALDAGEPSSALHFALGFHFFSHFLWPWWLALSSFLVEPEKIRRRIFLGCALIGAAAGGLVFATMLLYPEWMTVAVKQHSIIYNFSIPIRSDIPMPVTPLMIYGLLVLLPLLFSSHKPIRIFGVLVVMSMVLASAAYNEAFVSVWCFFAAVLSLYLVYMIRRLAAEKNAHGNRDSSVSRPATERI